METARDEADKVLKKQKLCASRTETLLDEAIAQVQTLGFCKTKSLNATSSLKEFNTLTKDLHTAISKLGKALEKTFRLEHDLARILRPTELDDMSLRQVVVEHLYREGSFQLGDLMASEAGLSGALADALKQPYVALHQILQDLRQQRMDSALAWAREHREELSCTPHTPSTFEFRLHALQFVHTLKQQGPSSALRYAKNHLAAFHATHMSDIQRLLGCLAFAHKLSNATPYADLLSGLTWDALAKEFAQQACRVQGEAHQSPLTVATAAGVVALPAFLKLADLFQRNALGTDLRTCTHLPVEIELGQEFAFHSIFACPVSKDQSTADNPPVLLPCNHVLCEHSVQRLAKNRNRLFKCPYCPMESRGDNLVKLVFPDPV